MDTEYTSPIIEEFDDPTDTFKDNEFVSIPMLSSQS